ncbi:MAG TPA: transaldolase [Polyangiaceae bacterium]|jgi:transaldolase
MHPIRTLATLGQSVWLDFLNRAMLRSGELERLIRDDAIAGMTSNPTIFEESIAKGTDYDDLIGGAGVEELDAMVLERIMVRDIRDACDAFRAAWEASGGRDGLVSVEVAPGLAYDTLGSIDAARRLWAEIARPNLMVKIPATREGLLAIERCLTDGININITLLFSLERYEQVAAAYVRALETRRCGGLPIDRLVSVASFFVSRVDTKIDPMLDQSKASYERGMAGIRNAQLAYESYRRLVESPRWRALEAEGARPQRLLWASTSTKNKAYSDLHYVDALVAPDTIDTVPKATLRALLDHGKPEVRIDRDIERARSLVADLAAAGVDYARVMQELENEGVRKFEKSYDEAITRIGDKRRQLEEQQPGIGGENPPKRTEFGDRESARAMTHRELKQIP